VPFERAVLAEILRLFNGYNNGDIAITYKRMSERLSGRSATAINNGRIAAAIDQLVSHGLIDEPTTAAWLEKRARRYRLTFISSGKAPPFRSATNDYLRWTPEEEKIGGDDLSPRTPLTGDAPSPRGKDRGDARSPSLSGPQRESTHKTPSLNGDVQSLVICKPWVGANSHPDITPQNTAGEIGPTCQRCSEPFKPADRGQPKRYCSERCRKAEEARRRHERQKAAA
jgi:hypothetical protein